jgi:hypothetical protein
MHIDSFRVSNWVLCVWASFYKLRYVWAIYNNSFGRVILKYSNVFQQVILKYCNVFEWAFLLFCNAFGRYTINPFSFLFWQNCPWLQRVWLKMNYNYTIIIMFLYVSSIKMFILNLFCLRFYSYALYILSKVNIIWYILSLKSCLIYNILKNQ